MKRTSWVVEADGDENIPGSTQPSLGQNESTMERHVISPFTQPSKQRSDNSTVPQTNSPGNVNAPSVNSGQAANMENPAMQAMDPEGNGNIIMQGSSRDYLNMIEKLASDSDIYHRGFADGRAGKEMDKSLSNLSDDYFNGWQDGQVYKHLPVDEVETNLQDMKPGSNTRGASVDSECYECGSVRIAHCGTCEGREVEASNPIQPADLSTTKGKITHWWRGVTIPFYEGKTFHPDNVKPAGEETEVKEKTASFHCKNCNDSGVVCRDCGCAR